MSVFLFLMSTEGLRNYVECGGLTPLSAAQVDATQVVRGGSGALGSKSSAKERVFVFSVSIVARNAGFAVRANHEPDMSLGYQTQRGASSRAGEKRRQAAALHMPDDAERSSRRPNYRRQAAASLHITADSEII